MKKSQTWNPFYTKRKNTSTYDLVTQNENTLASQQSEWNSGTQQRTKIRTATTLRDQDDYEDVIAEELDSLFITPEEEEGIRRVLELARKGKINQSNAFQLPVRVISPEATENTSMRFWKFASELLHTSMNIYEKRVENVFLGSNHMVSSLIRAQRNEGDDFQEDELRSRSRKKRKEQMFMDIEAIGQSEAISTHEIKHIHTEDPFKISTKEKQSFFLADVIFQKRMQTFDSNSLSGLFLNSFQLGSNLQLQFLNPNNSLFEDLKNKPQESIDLSLNQRDEFIDIFFEKDMKKLSFICHNRNLFTELGNFRSEQMRNTNITEETRIEDYEDIYETFLGENEEDEKSMAAHIMTINESSDYIQSHQNDSVQISHRLKEEQYFYSAQTVLDQETHFLSNQLPLSETRLQRNIFLNQKQCHTMMTPWELQFKGMKLQVKRQKNTLKSKTQKSRAMQNSLQIDFNFEEIRQEDVFQVKTSSCLLSSRVHRTHDKFLMHKVMNPFLEIINKKSKPTEIDKNTQDHHIPPPIISNFDELQLKMQHPFVSHQPNPKIQFQQTTFDPFEGNDMIDIQQSQTPSLQNIQSNISSECIRNLKTFGLRNIRDIKISIFEELTKRRSINMSDISLQISPASMLIVFLHLVNEKNINLISLDNETDVQITL